MAYADVLHSRLVTGLRIALPLAALGLLSTLFLVSRDIDPSRALPGAAVDAEDLARDPRITTLRLSTVTPDGLAVTLTAGTVRIAAGGRETTTAQEVSALLTGLDGVAWRIDAGSASVDAAQTLLDMTGGVRMSDGRGHRLEGERMILALDRQEMTSPGPVTGTAPLGRIEAGSMWLSLAGPAARTRFAGGVRLVHQPVIGDRP